MDVSPRRTAKVPFASGTGSDRSVGDLAFLRPWPGISFGHWIRGQFGMDRSALNGRRIVVVDDEGGVRDMFTEYLAQHGYEVRAAADGAALDRLLAEATPDLILLDVNMPGEDGFSIA